MIDLHSHTTASDGQHSPTELIGLASRTGITHLAVTDHDTVAGLSEALVAAEALGITVIPGIEMSAFIDSREVHILGHFIRSSEGMLVEFCQKFGDERRTRMERMVARMRELGFPITMDHVHAIAKGAHLCRPHLARALVELGYCTSTKDAFDRFLGNDKPAFIDKKRITAESAVTLIQTAGGSATLAHPTVSKVSPQEIEKLAAAGLAGLEVFHPEQPSGTREKLLEVANRLNLIPTGGSDFHGEKIAPGRRLGAASITPEALEQLRLRATEYVH
jgi:predicted metal-dependent phosphoesterase TrpH